jgi:hypothetical protein
MAAVQAESMVGGTIRRKLIHRESFRASVLYLSEIQAVLQSIAAMKSVLTTPSFLSSGTHTPSQKPRVRGTRATQANSTAKKDMEPGDCPLVQIDWLHKVVRKLAEENVLPIAN